MEEEHVKILMEGVARWNAWREGNPGSIPDLRGADLREQALGGSYLIAADLSGADLRGTVLLGANLLGADLHDADLRGADLGFASLYAASLRGADLKEAIFAEADLRGVDLTDADLRGADLNDANLRNADLRNANLGGASLRDTDLSYADLRKADLGATLLWRANLSHARLEGATLNGALLGETILAHTHLGEVKDLESCVHLLPSAIDHQTLVASGPLPTSFLRSCGVPERLIAYAPSLLDDPIQSYFCLISHADKDKKFALKLHDELQDRGVRCWLAAASQKVGQKAHIKIDEAIPVFDKVVIVFSSGCVGSEWVKDEVAAAIDKERETRRRVLVPVRIDDSVMSAEETWARDVRGNRDIVDFGEWRKADHFDRAFSRLLRTLADSRGI